MKILFDLDGTLTDSKPGIVRTLQHALAELGRAVPADDELDWCLGPPLHETMARLLGNDREAAQGVAHYRERYRTHGMYENVVYPGIPEALAALRARGARLFVATSKAEPVAVQILEHFGLAKHFEAIHGATLDGSRDKKAAIIAHLLSERGIDPAQALMVGDRKHDVLGALENRVRPIGVTWGYGSREELLVAGAARLCTHPVELAEACAAGLTR